MWHYVLWQSRVPFFSPSACTVQGMHTSVSHQEHKCDWLHTWSLLHEASTHSGFPMWPILRAHSDAPHLPGLFQLRRPPLFQDGLHGTDEFRSYILEEKKNMWDADCAAVPTATAPLLSLTKSVTVWAYSVCCLRHFIERAMKGNNFMAKNRTCELPF